MATYTHLKGIVYATITNLSIEGILADRSMTSAYLISNKLSPSHHYPVLEREGGGGITINSYTIMKYFAFYLRYRTYIFSSSIW